MKDRDEFPMILIGNKADLDHQRQVRRSFAVGNPIVDDHVGRWMCFLNPLKVPGSGKLLSLAVWVWESQNLTCFGHQVSVDSVSPCLYHLHSHVLIL